jgi:glutamate-1-semialdehyde 2,1-aminomutase
MNESRRLFQEASQYIPGGVNSPVRACLSVNSDPLFIDSAAGSHLVSADGQEYIDYVMSWGPMLAGHAHPDIMAAAQAALEKGASFGAPCRDEVELARMLVDALPGVDMVRMVNSGTEATMSAARLARGFTSRPKILKFVGCYHGHCDSFLASAGSGVATLAIPGTPGVPEEIVAHTLLAPYNDLDTVRGIFEEHGDQIAGVIVEPVAGNMGLVPPAPGFLEGLREMTTNYEALLIFDEVITGFRMAYGGAQNRFGITPDLTCLGKIIGGGFPVGAYGGRRDIMERIAPCGDVYQAGTLSGNPVAMAAGVAALRVLSQSDYDALEQRTRKLAEDLAGILADKGQPVTLNAIGSAFTMFFCEGPVRNFEEAQTSDALTYAKYYAGMRDAGIYLAPSGFECTFTSFAHSEEDYERTLEAARALEL